MEIKSKEITIVPINKIKMNPKNRNFHSQDQIDRLAKLYKYQGMRNPIIISNRSGYIVCGHGRFLAAKRCGMKELPAIYQDFDSEEQEYTYGISDNSISSWAELDLSGIHEDLQDLEPFDLELLGIEDFKLEPDPKDKQGSKELNENDFQNFDHKCPRCNFEWSENE